VVYHRKIVHQARKPVPQWILKHHFQIDEKIAKFIALKQMDNNVANVQEFCGARHQSSFLMSETFEGDNCARTQAAFQPRAGNRHVIVKRVVNQSGPQTNGIIPVTQPWSASPSQSSTSRPTFSSCDAPTTSVDNSSRASLPAGVTERLANMEAHLKLHAGKPVPSDIYKRLQCLENRILALESSSPEYFISAVNVHLTDKLQITEKRRD
jgi:hypothetical protein